LTEISLGNLLNRLQENTIGIIVFALKPALVSLQQKKNFLKNNSQNKKILKKNILKTILTKPILKNNSQNKKISKTKHSHSCCAEASTHKSTFEKFRQSESVFLQIFFVLRSLNFSKVLYVLRLQRNN